MALNQLGLGFIFTAKDLASGVIRRIQDSFGQMEGKSSAATSAFGTNLAQFGQGLAIMGAGVAGLAMLDHAVEVSGEFSHAIAEVSTLIDEATFSTAELSRVSLDLAAFYGGSATGQARALYQTISAGVTDAAKATDLLRVANELAIGGVTETKTAVDALTNVVNAYSSTGAQARDVSDAFFVAIKAGKTTAAELAATMGRVAPTASSLGVSFSDLLASIAAISTQGLNTAEAVTGMKAAMANIIKPSSDATKEAARLGIKFDAAALRAQGLTAFLQSITSSANFNADSLSKLFGSVEALNAVMALTSNNSAKYNEILGQMGGRSGATKAAFDKMADTLTFQESRFKALKDNVLIVIGQALEPVAKAIVRVANTVLESFLRIPKPIRDFAVKLFGAISLLLVLVGGFIAAKAGIALLIIGLKAVGITIGGVLASLLPLIAAFAAIALVVTGFVVAFRRDVGGIGTFFENVVARTKLLFQALGQLFSDGGFSGAVMAELNNAENAGIKQFAIRVFQIVHRIKRFFAGIAEGFGAAIEAARPVFEAFVGALRRLGEVLGIVGAEGANAAAGIPSDEFAAFGRTVGQIAAVLVEVFVGALTFVIEYWTAAIGAFKTVIRPLLPIFDAVKNSVGIVFQELGKLGAMFGFASTEGQRAGGTMGALSSVAQFLGSVVGTTAAIIAGSIGMMVQFVVQQVGVAIGVFRAIVEVISGVIDIVAGLVTGNWSLVWTGFKKVALGAINFVAQLLLGFVQTLASVTDTVAGVFGKKLGGADAIRGLRASIERGLTGGTSEMKPAATGTPQPVATTGFATSAGTMPAVAATEAQVAALATRPAAPPTRETPPTTTNVNLVVDGEVLARATARAERSNAARSFAPLPAPG